jgi:hypothetical protein
MSTSAEVINTRTGVGAGIGAVIGFAFGGPVGAGAGALLGGAIAHASGEPEPKGELTPRRKLIFTRAMESVKEPAELIKLSDAFAGEGFAAQAALLRQRAGLRQLPPETQAKRRAAFRKAMASDNPDAIKRIAGAFEGVGSIDAAKILRNHADAVHAAHSAGKSAKPMSGGNVAQFADKLGKAIIHFGPTSGQAQMAARNLIQARGKTSSEGLVAEVIKIAASALQVQSPGAESPAAASEGSPGAAAEAAEQAPMPPPAGAVEPTVMGPPAGRVEPPAVMGGVAVQTSAAAPTQDIEEAVAAAEQAAETLATEASAGGAPAAPSAAEIAASASMEPIVEVPEMIPDALRTPSSAGAPGEEELK